MPFFSLSSLLVSNISFQSLSDSLKILSPLLDVKIANETISHQKLLSKLLLSVLIEKCLISNDESCSENDRHQQRKNQGEDNDKR